MNTTKPGPNKFISLCWLALLFWAMVGYAVTAFKIDALFFQKVYLPFLPLNFVSRHLAWGDFIFLFLAALNLFLFATAYLGLKSAVRCFLLIALGSAAVETIGTLSGYPFGYYLYTANLGPRVCRLLPLAIPLAWWTVVAGFYFTVRNRFPGWNQRLVALGTACCATAFDCLMEPFAWLVKSYWLWVPGFVPWQNYVAWFALSFLLARFSPLHGDHAPSDIRKPSVILALMAGLFVLGRLVA